MLDGVVIDDSAFVGLPSFPGTFEPVEIHPVWPPVVGPASCPGGLEITAPPFLSAIFSTQLCFLQEYPNQLDWPPTPCDSVCTQARPVAACTGNRFWATTAQIDRARSYIKPLISGTLSAEGTSDGQRTLNGPLTLDEETALAVSLALVRNNIDLVKWAVCTAVSHARDNRTRDPSGNQPPAPTYTPQQASDFIAAGLLGGMNIYVLSRFLAISTSGPLTGIVPNGVTGIATDQLTPWDGGEGPVIPIKHPYFAAGNGIVSAIANPGYTGSDGSAGLCAALALASVFLHEAIHLLDPVDPDSIPSGAWDSMRCWTVQSMAVSAFNYALARRFPCLEQMKMQNCCPKTRGAFFMFPDPIGAGFQEWVPATPLTQNYLIPTGQCR